MENPFANKSNRPDHQGPFNAPNVSVHGDEMEVDQPYDEMRPEEPQRYKVPKTKWW